MYAELPFCDTSIRVGLYGNCVAEALAMSAKRLPGRRCRFRRIIFVCRQSIPSAKEGVLQSELVLTIAGPSSPTRSDLPTGPVALGDKD